MSLSRRRTGDDAAAYTATAAARAHHAGWLCEAAWHPSCPAVRGLPGDAAAHEAHHVHQRRHGGPDTFENLLWLCIHCHNRVHRRPADAEARGLLIPKARHLRVHKRRQILYERDDHGTRSCYDLGCDCDECVAAAEAQPPKPPTRAQRIARWALLPPDRDLDPF